MSPEQKEYILTLGRAYSMAPEYSLEEGALEQAFISACERYGFDEDEALALSGRAFSVPFEAEP